MLPTTLIIDHAGHYTDLTSSRQTAGLKRFAELKALGDATWYLGASDTRDGADQPEISGRLINGPRLHELLFQSRVSPYSASQLNMDFLVQSLPRLLEQIKPQTIEVFSVSKTGVEILRVVRNHCANSKLRLHLEDGELLCPFNGVFINSDGVQCHMPGPRSCSSCTKSLSAPDVFYRSKFIDGHLALVDEIVLYPGVHISKVEPWLKAGFQDKLVHANQAPSVNRPRGLQSGGIAYFGSSLDGDALQLLKKALSLASSDSSLPPVRIDVFPTDRHTTWPASLVEQLEQVGIQVQSKWAPHYFERYMESYSWALLPSSPSADSVRFVEMARQAGLGVIADDSYGSSDHPYAPHSAASLAKAIASLGDH